MSLFEDTNPKPLVEHLIEMQLFITKVTASNTSMYFPNELRFSEIHTDRLSTILEV